MIQSQTITRKEAKAKLAAFVEASSYQGKTIQQIADERGVYFIAVYDPFREGSCMNSCHWASRYSKDGAEQEVAYRRILNCHCLVIEPKEAR